MARFVILEHDYPHLHWDFMLEAGPVLKTWRLDRMPTEKNEEIRAEVLGDHRLAYLEYEGPLSGDRGQVMRRDQGTYEIELGSLTEDYVVVRLLGAKLQGRATLRREGPLWTLGWQSGAT